MGRIPNAKLADVVADCALSAVATQRMWDAEHAGALNTPRLLMKEWQFDVSLSLTATRETSFAIQAQVVNLGFAVTHSRTQANSSRISLLVEQIPAPRS